MATRKIALTAEDYREIASHCTPYGCPWTPIRLHDGTEVEIYVALRTYWWNDDEEPDGISNVIIEGFECDTPGSDEDIEVRYDEARLYAALCDELDVTPACDGFPRWEDRC